ncbi:unnamed protein product [Pleuronectes platessa]|uniref:Uncharacterized protein n=1 Tax=Pleuronectes platessa TaxID=8262 RepID=A0A9N7VPS1_PLEPL|nr:unnamed protein product [Pleuronectes platessa]
MTARPRPPHNRTGGFRKGGEQSQSCGVRHRPRSIRHPPASADRSVGHRSRPAKAHGGGWKSGQGGTARSWTVLRRSGGDRKIERVCGGGRWESTRMPHQHNPGLGRHAGPGVQRETLSTCGGVLVAMQSNPTVWESGIVKFDRLLGAPTGPLPTQAGPIRGPH